MSEALSLSLTRRRFLQLSVMGAIATMAKPALALMPRATTGLRELVFHNLHTDERTRTIYWRDGAYDKTGLARINQILRDFRSGDVHPMHPGLLDLLHDLQAKCGHEGPIEIISGYRSPHTNALLRSASGGVAGHSYHMRGMAIDIRLPGTALTSVRNNALTMQRGGVGFYPSSGFVHVDVGPVRRWG
jgi:uncharacterized protein YcbK (DUF882 family)